MRWEMPNSRQSSAAATTSSTVFALAPPMMGTRPLTSSVTSSTRILRSSRLRKLYSLATAGHTTAAAPFSIANETTLHCAATSILFSEVNKVGITGRTPHSVCSDGLDNTELTFLYAALVNWIPMIEPRKPSLGMTEPFEDNAP